MTDTNRNQSGTEGAGLSGRTIRVTPETLGRKAGELDANASDVRLLTANMTQKVQELTGRIWTGDARSAYVTGFTALQAEIDQYTPLLVKHALNLKTIAAQYEITETEARQLSGALPGNIF